MKISFDFDDTLSEKPFQKLAEILLKGGAEIYVVTTRLEAWNEEVWEATDGLGIERKNVHFTNGALKKETLQNLQIDLHFDDAPMEINATNQANIPACLVQFDKLKLLRFLQQEENL